MTIFNSGSFIRAIRQPNNCLAAAEVGIVRGVGTLIILVFFAENKRRILLKTHREDSYTKNIRKLIKFR